MLQPGIGRSKSAWAPQTQNSHEARGHEALPRIRGSPRGLQKSKSSPWGVVDLDGNIPRTQDELAAESRASESRLARAQDLLQTQASAVKQVSRKLGEHTDDDQGKSLQERLADMELHRATSSSWNTKEPHSSHGTKGAADLSGRFARFTARRQQVLQEEQERLEEKLAAQEEADARRLERREKMRKEERRRHFLKEQLRNEQRKVVKEMERAQEQEKERVYQEKVLKVKMPQVHANGKKAHGGPGVEQPLDRSTSVPVLLPTVTSKSPRRTHELSHDGTSDGDVLSEQMRSRAIYTEMLDKWSQIIAENDKRSDSTWVKMVGSDALMPEARRCRADGRRQSKKAFKTASIEAPPSAAKELRPLSGYRREALNAGCFGQGPAEEQRLELSRMRSLLRGEGVALRNPLMMTTTM